MPKRCWLMKTEPDVYSIDDLKREKKSHWEGVRNYQARNFMRDDMKAGDAVLIYHSNAKPPGIAGLAKVCSKPYPDPTAFDATSKYFDPKSDPDNPRWILVDVAFVKKFNELIPLQTLKDTPALKDLLVLKRGQRLSIQPVADKDYRYICKMAGTD